MIEPPALLDRLRTLVGRELRYQGLRCTLVEIIDQPPVLVLRPIGAEPVIQADNFGKPLRHAPPLFELPMFSPDGVSLSAELRMLNLPEGDPEAGD